MAEAHRADRVLKGLLRRLAAGEWKAGGRLPATRCLEGEFGVSHMTMLAALRMAAERGLVSVSPRRPVLVTAKGVARARDALASLARGGSGRRLAVMVPDQFWPVGRQVFYGELARTVLQAAGRHGVAAEAVRWPVLDQVAFVHELIDEGYSAAFALGVRPEYLMSLHVLWQQRFPLVLFNAAVPGLRLPAVTMDEYGGAQKLASALADRGHRNLCMISWAFDSRLKGAKHRVMGWLDYLDASGLIRTCVMPVVYAVPREEVLRHFGRLFEVASRPTGVVFAYGRLWGEFLAHRSHRSMRVPDEVSLATFDPMGHVPDSTWCPPVTTLSIDMDRAGECVMEMVGKTMAGTLRPRSIRLPMHLKLTESIGPAPSGRPGPGVGG